MEQTLASYDPSNGELLGEVTVTAKEHIDKIVAAAHVATKNWRQVEIRERLRILSNAYAQIEPQMDELATLLSREMGKDIRRSSGEVSGVIYGGPYTAQQAMRALESKNLGSDSWLEYKPLGVVAVISPWNYPLAMAIASLPRFGL